MISYIQVHCALIFSYFDGRRHDFILLCVPDLLYFRGLASALQKTDERAFSGQHTSYYRRARLFLGAPGRPRSPLAASPAISFSAMACRSRLRQ